jgi:4-hydroxy-tetrahydrodipicolinate synthase
MLSPFTPDGGIDEPAVDRIVTRLVGGGVHGIFPLGTTGESASIAPDEKKRLVARTAQAVNGRVTVYAGISANCYQDSVDAARSYAKLGVAALVAHVPSYYGLSDQQIESYYLRLADAVPLPLVLYNIPVTTHHSIPLNVIDRLRRHTNIVALKDSAGDPARIAELLKLTGGRDGFPVLIGNSTQFILGLRHGGIGIIPSGGHLAAAQYRALFDAAIADDWATVEKLQAETDAICARYLKGRSLGDGLAALKAILQEQQICGRTMLPPLTDHVGAV